MANIKPYTDQIANAVYGEEVRSSIINALNKVNDDNESYQEIKDEILEAKEDIDLQVSVFDQKVEDARDVTEALETAISNANTAKTNLVNATSTANTAKTNLETATSNANTATANANTAKTNLVNATSTANTAKTNLETATSNANTAKTNLETAISNANTAKSNLETTISTAGTSKSNLETAISNASTAKSELEAVITNANTAKSNLSDTILSANTAKENLDASINTGNALLQSLSAENASAYSNIKELRSENFNAQEILAGVANIEAYLGITTDVMGVCVDYENKTFTRLAGAVGKSAGADFDSYTPFGGRRKCNVDDNGNILAYYGDSNYAEDGSNGQVMVYQPKFYYLVAPVDYDVQDTGIGYHLRKANYYISDKARTGFRLHPAFYDESGNELDYILFGAYEGSIYDVSASTYLLEDEQVMDATASTGDLFCSIANAKPASGLTQNLTRPNIEQMCKNRGSGWHSLGIKIASMEQLLMLVELGQMNTQTAVGRGVCDKASGSGNESEKTGMCASIGNGTGMASGTNGKVSIIYRGDENPWGNIWKFVYGVNIWGNGSMAGGEPYICSDYNYAESKNSDNYERAGFTVANANGYISAMGYSTSCDWLFMPSETLGNSSLPVGDYTWVTANLNGYRIARLGGYWYDGDDDGGFDWYLSTGVGARTRAIGGRLVYVPTATPPNA